MKTGPKRGDLHLSILYFFICGLLFIGYFIDFIIFKDWSFLYVTILAPLVLGFVYWSKSKHKRRALIEKLDFHPSQWRKS
ncbi:MAG TPA: hypothetical protein VEY70_06355 [Metabacillus sp.]|nr:hypothetical protein [Metabacillus sp.]